MQDDLDAIRKGTLTGSAAVTQVQTDTAAVLSSMGLTSAQITQIQTDQAAVETAIQANSSSATSTTTTSSTTEIDAPVGQSAYLVGIPGVSGFGMRGTGGFGMGIRMGDLAVDSMGGAVDSDAHDFWKQPRGSARRSPGFPVPSGEPAPTCDAHVESNRTKSPSRSKTTAQ